MRDLPTALGAALADALAGLGDDGPIIRSDAVGGGCINNGARIETRGGRAYFLKWNQTVSADVFDAEADGLRALRSIGAPLRVPEPLAWGGGEAEPAWLLLEHVEAGRTTAAYARDLGRGLAALHAAPAPHGQSVEPSFGWHRDNWIGSLAQRNPAAPAWATFWRDQRIAPQLEAARARGRLAGSAGRVLDRVLELVEPALSPLSVRPSLLHGDLWGGNAFPGPEGEPVLIDPAVYAGHSEVDLAMTELFGGFGTDFSRAYAEHRAIPPDYEGHRRDLYQLYYLLVHVNLFGSSYESATLGAARSVVAALG